MSVAGKRKGFAGERSGLAFSYIRLLETMRPRWFVWENVPGVLSSNGGEDFKAFIRSVDEIGYSCAWRVLDAQYVRVDGYPRAVPQRRCRVFVVGHLGADWRYPASVLFEPDCLPRDTPPRRKTGAGGARSVTANAGGASGKERQHTFVGADGAPLNMLCMAHGQGNAEISEAVSPTLTCNHEAPIAFRWAASPSQDMPIGIDYCHTLMASQNGGPAVCYKNQAPIISAKAGTGGNNLPLVMTSIVRRLTPRECERLMGFPDDHTRIPWRKKPAELCPDGPRYKACGNSMCVNVMRWIGMRIELVERKIKEIEIQPEEEAK